MTKLKLNTASIREKLGTRNLVLVGLMGAGKTTIGRRLSRVLNLPFVDADAEIEKAAGQSVEEIFETYGEDHFRDGERKVIARILQDGPQVVATGGGAFMNQAIRTSIAETSLSIWLKADADLLVKRVGRRPSRPLLKQGDPAEILRELIKKRYPVYEQADIVIQSRDVAHDVIVRDIVDVLNEMTLENDGQNP